MTTTEVLSIIVASAIPIVLIGSLWQRIAAGKAIGWQFIRYTVIAIAIPLVGVLALNNLLSEAAATIIAAALGYAFGKGGGEE